MRLSAPIAITKPLIVSCKMSDVPPLRDNGGKSDESEDDSESNGSGETQHNVWNHMMELLTLQGSGPRIQWCLQEEELCKTALTYHFALDIIFMCGASENPAIPFWYFPVSAFSS